MLNMGPEAYALMVGGLLLLAFYFASQRKSGMSAGEQKVIQGEQGGSQVGPSALDMLRKKGLAATIARQSLLDNVVTTTSSAMVVVTADLSGIARKGSKIDITVSILDDSTSSVDLQTEYNIQKALDNLMHGRTSFVIAQRISTVLNADQILVLDKGRVAARGTHEELMESSPIYAEIYHSQLIGDAVTDKVTGDG